MPGPPSSRPRDPAPAISVRALRVVRGATVAVSDLSLDVRAGTVTGLLGPSGCGKSTLMRAIVGVQRMQAGEVTVLGLPAGTPALRSRIGYVTQAPSVYGDLSVAENLRYFAALAGAPPPEVARAAEIVGLGGYGEHIVGQLSGGERSRVSLASALLGAPEVLVLDEPTVGLDPVLRAELWATFHDLADAGTTLLISSHVMDEARECDELLLMREGALLAQLTPQELRDRTGEQDLGGAFLAMIRAAEGTAA